ncbi:MAG: hypothetical protein CMO81_07605 [Waddliaceae bacterium]|nr:hypothetical protein [Waddliaceae bacterium]
MSNSKPFSELKQRLLISTIPISIVVMAICLSPYTFFAPFLSLTVSTLTAVGIWEFYHMSETKGFTPNLSTGFLAAFLIPSSFYLLAHFDITFINPSSVGFFILFLLFVQACRTFEGAIANLAISIFGIVYVILPLSLLLPIVFSPTVREHAAWYLAYILCVTKMTDTGAYFIGKKYGRNKLAPELSPGKTIEGAIGGTAIAALVSILLKLSSDAFSQESAFHLSVFGALLLGAGISAIGQIGDLAESLLKRDAGIKDSNQLPGLGGVLDMTDSLIFSIPAFYLVLEYYNYQL